MRSDRFATRRFDPVRSGIVLDAIPLSATMRRLTGRLVQDLGGVLAPLAVFGNRLSFNKVICWFEDGWRRGAVIRDLNRLNDHYLSDLGIIRNDIESIADTLMKREPRRILMQ